MSNPGPPESSSSVWPPEGEAWVFPTNSGEKLDSKGRRGWTALWRGPCGARRAQCFFISEAGIVEIFAPVRLVKVLEREPT